MDRQRPDEAKSANPTVVTPLPSSETICASYNNLKSRWRR